MNGLPVGELIGDIGEVAHEFIEEVPSPGTRFSNDLT